MLPMKILLDKYEVYKYILSYSSVYPDEILPTVELVYKLRDYCDVVLETKHNLIYLKQDGNRYEVVAHWCLSNSYMSFKDNMKSFFEVLRLFKSLNSQVYFEFLNSAYTEAIDNHNKRFM